MPHETRLFQRAARRRICPYAFLAVLTGAFVYVSILGCARPDPPGRPSAADPPDTSAGKSLYAAQACSACHAINGTGGNVGPDLSDEGQKGRSKEWLARQLRDPKSFKSDSVMPAYDKLRDGQIGDLVAYLMSLSTRATAATSAASVPAAAGPPALAAVRNIQAGAQMWSQNCGRCHNYRAPAEYSDSQWAVAMHHMRLRVPLTGEQQQMILEFLQAGN